MGFFDKMKASVGIGGAKLQLALPAGPAPRGGTLEGTVILTAGKLAQRCNGVTVALRVTRMVPQVVDGKASERQVTEDLATVAVAGGALDLAPGATHQLAFAIAIPADGSGSFALHASADIPGAIDPSDTEVIQLGDAGWSWSRRIDELLAALAADPLVTVVTAERGAPLTDAQLAEVEAAIGYALDPRFVAFFRAANGLRVVWTLAGPSLATQFAEHRAGSINIPALATLFAPPPAHVFVVGTKPRGARVEALGGWDAHEFRTALRDLDNYDVSGETPFARPALVAAPRFPDPPVVMTESYAAVTSDRAPMLARDYLALVIATLGIDVRRARFHNHGFAGNHPLFVAPPGWLEAWPRASEQLRRIHDGAGYDAAQLTGAGDATAYAAYHESPPAPVRRLLDDPLAGMRIWPAAGVAYVPAHYALDTLLAPSLGDHEYGTPAPVDAPSIAAARALIGEPVILECTYTGVIAGCLVDVDDEGTLTVVQLDDGMTASRSADVANVRGFGRAYLFDAG